MILFHTIFQNVMVHINSWKTIAYMCKWHIKNNIYRNFISKIKFEIQNSTNISYQKVVKFNILLKKRKTPLNPPPPPPPFPSTFLPLRLLLPPPSSSHQGEHRSFWAPKGYPSLAVWFSESLTLVWMSCIYSHTIYCIILPQKLFTLCTIHLINTTDI